jgi:diguanylate cyclase (GGDEF)-like protein
MWDHSTIHVTKGDVTLFQSLGEPAQRRACLVLYSGPDIGRRFNLDSGAAVIGRSPECSVHIDSPGLSRRHAALEVEGDRVALADLGSANGSYVNDVRLVASVALKDGDLIRLGKVVLRFYERHSLDALLHDHIYRMATVDADTGVFTKRYLLEALEREIKQARRAAGPLSLVCLDLDHFKAVNDRYGHNGGDLALRAAAVTLRSVLRDTDILGRTGGEEFAVVLPGTELDTASALAERMRAALAAQTIELPQPGEDLAATVLHRQTASFGVAQFRAGMPDARALLGAADALLYAAKRSGRNQVCA